jgi:autotransporter adhesin
MENYLHPDAIHASLGIRVTFGDFDDVPDIVAEQTHIAGGGVGAWNNLDKDKKRKKISKVKRRLNNEAASAMTPALLTDSDLAGDVRGWLAEIRRLYES